MALPWYLCGGLYGSDLALLFFNFLIQPVLVLRPNYLPEKLGVNKKIISH